MKFRITYAATPSPCYLGYTKSRKWKFAENKYIQNPFRVCSQTTSGGLFLTKEFLEISFTKLCSLSDDLMAFYYFYWVAIAEKAYVDQLPSNSLHILLVRFSILLEILSAQSTSKIKNLTN